MMNTIALVNLKEQNISPTHVSACLEFIEGFKEYGYETFDAKTFEECLNKKILLLSNHNVDMNFYNKLNEKSPDTIFIMWCCNIPFELLPFKKIIKTGSYCGLTAEPYINNDSKFVSLLLRANEDPKLIGTYKKNYLYDGCFMGTAYKKEWCDNLKNILYHDINKKKMLSYNDRKNIYLSSKIAFGFQADGNIAINHVTQRIFEGLCYGCIVISDSKAAEILTNGIVIYVKDYDDFIEKYNYYNSKNYENDEEILKKINDGYEWSKKYGTNRFSAKLFLNQIEKLKY